MADRPNKLPIGQQQAMSKQGQQQQQQVVSTIMPASPAIKVHDELTEGREKWGNQLDFILSCLGYAVGLGNVWRFPYLCGRNGGAAFLIPYAIVLVFAGFPTFYLELAIGQYAALTPHLLYRRMSPLFTGIGYTMVAISLFTGIYYNMVIALSMFYLWESIKGLFSWSLPWDKCDPQRPWIDELCFDDRKNLDCVGKNLTYFLGSCYSNQEIIEQSLMGKVANLSGENRENPALQFNRYVLGVSREMVSDGISNGIGFPQWHLLVALICAWILVFFCLIKGIKSSGKVVYFTATFPYVILVILLIRGVTLDGAMDGLRFYAVPNMSKLIESNVWRDAANQIFFSLSLGGGGLSTLASYNRFHNNLFRDTLIVVLGNCGTSLFAGCVIFPILGFVAKQMHPNKAPMERVRQLAASGPSLAFIAYPNAITRIAAAPVWGILFFFMLIILGIDSQVTWYGGLIRISWRWSDPKNWQNLTKIYNVDMVIVEVVITSVIDQWPMLRHGWKKTGVVAAICVVSFFCGVVLTTPGGDYLVNLVDTYAGGWTLVIACLVEVVMVAWFYGVFRFVDDIKLMLGKSPNGCYTVLGYPVNPYWWINWVALTPLLLFCILVFSLVKYSGLSYGDWEYPIGWEICGWLITISCIIWIPLIAIYRIIVALLAGKSFSSLIRPTSDWGPGDLAARQLLGVLTARTSANQVPMQALAPPQLGAQQSPAYPNPAFGAPNIYPRGHTPLMSSPGAVIYPTNVDLPPPHYNQHTYSGGNSPAY